MELHRATIPPASLVGAVLARQYIAPTTPSPAPRWQSSSRKAPEAGIHPIAATGTRFDDVPPLALGSRLDRAIGQMASPAAAAPATTARTTPSPAPRWRFSCSRASTVRAIAHLLRQSTGFGDVAADYWAAAWIKQLAVEITGGCGTGNYCPENPVAEPGSAVFLVRTFDLP